MSEIESNLSGQFMDVAIDDISPNPWNPNRMDDEMFNRLADEIEEVGFINPLQVVPLADDGGYRIIGGEHRWRVATILGYETIPCIVLNDEKWEEEDLQQFVTMRLNMISGKLNPEKFMKMYTDLSEKYDHDALSELMGFTDQEVFDKITGQVRKGLEDSGIDKKHLEKFDEVAKEIKTVDDLSNIINKIFNEHGDKLQYNFMYFGYGGQEHAYINLTAQQFKVLKKYLGTAEENEEDVAMKIMQLIAQDM